MVMLSVITSQGYREPGMASKERDARG